MKRFVLLSVMLAAAVPVVAQNSTCDQISGVWSESNQTMDFDHVWDDNCAVNAITYQIEVVDQTIQVTEMASSDELALCFCPYTTTNEVSGLAPGDYDVVWHYVFACTTDPLADHDFFCDTFTVTVPATDPVGEPSFATVGVAGCGFDPVGIADDANWSDIKALFR